MVDRVMTAAVVLVLRCSEGVPGQRPVFVGLSRTIDIVDMSRLVVASRKVFVEACRMI